MADPQVADRVKETTTKTGTGDAYVLGGASTGFQSYLTAFGAGAQVFYVVENGTDWEVGAGTLSTGPDTLTRDWVNASSNAGSPVDWAAGTKNIFCAMSAGDMLGYDATQYAAPGLYYGEVETEDATPTSMPLLRNGSPLTGQIVTVVVTANNGSTVKKGWELKFLVGDSALVGSLTKNVIGATAGAAACDVDVVFGGGGGIEVEVTGIAAEDIGWAATAMQAGN